MIKIASQKNYMVALESVAMTDIVMNLFIFFFISFSLLYTFSAAQVSKIEVKLPKASSAIVLDGSEKTALVITKKGEFFIDDKRIDARSIKRSLEKRLRSNPDMALILKIDGLAKFSNVSLVLDIVNELRIDRVSIAVVKKEGN